jgi:hypothetical protein
METRTGRLVKTARGPEIRVDEAKDHDYGYGVIELFALKTRMVW